MAGESLIQHWPYAIAFIQALPPLGWVDRRSRVVIIVNLLIIVALLVYSGLSVLAAALEV